MKAHFHHTPVLLKESLDLLAPKAGSIYVDATLGGGGHSLEILKRTDGKAQVIGIDQDEDAISAAKENFEGLGHNIRFVKDNFSNIKTILNEQSIEKISGILFDLGVSSHQFDTPERGFSLRADGPLDMRMSSSLNTTAEDIVNGFERAELKRIIKELGEERFAGRIANAIAKAREKRAIKSTLELKEIIEKAVPSPLPKARTDSARRTFQALRIMVNSELESLRTALNASLDMLEKGGRIVVISYHSLEDRIVKESFNAQAKGCVCPPKFPKCVCGGEKRLKVLTKKPVRPSLAEIKENSRASSAKLRAAEKI